MPGQVGYNFTTTTMAQHQISTDKGLTWVNFTPPHTLPMASADIHFFHRGKDSYLQIAEGDLIIRLYIAQTFSLHAVRNAAGKLMLNVGDGPIPAHDFDDFYINFDENSTGLLLARNGGGIGIADIRDDGYVLNAVVFNLKEVTLVCKNGQDNTGTVELYFSPAKKVTFVIEPKPL